MGKSKRILVAPLDWGLGHASRCVPIIRELQKQDCDILLAGSGTSGKWLQQEFPRLEYFDLPEYDVSYSSKSPMVISMLRQTPGILKTIQQEKKWMNDHVQKLKPDAIISDHRYGFYHPHIYSVFVAHQLFISGGGLNIVEPLLWKVNKAYIENFDMCWIPDVPGEINASGKLSHKENIPFDHTFIGYLSRFTKTDPSANNSYRASFVLSGPEPLRTELENIIIDQLDEVSEKYIMVRGTEKKLQRPVPENLEVIDLANSETLQGVLSNSEIIISRAGYSSIMDYLTLGKQALLIPTPGQTEQEYLAKYHLELGNFYSVKQEELEIKSDIPFALKMKPESIQQVELLKPAIQALINTI